MMAWPKRRAVSARSSHHSMPVQRQMPRRSRYQGTPTPETMGDKALAVARVVDTVDTVREAAQTRTPVAALHMEARAGGLWAGWADRFVCPLAAKAIPAGQIRRRDSVRIHREQVPHGPEEPALARPARTRAAGAGALDRVDQAHTSPAAVAVGQRHFACQHGATLAALHHQETHRKRLAPAADRAASAVESQRPLAYHLAGSAVCRTSDRRGFPGGYVAHNEDTVSRAYSLSDQRANRLLGTLHYCRSKSRSWKGASHTHARGRGRGAVYHPALCSANGLLLLWRLCGAFVAHSVARARCRAVRTKSEYRIIAYLLARSLLVC